MSNSNLFDLFKKLTPPTLDGESAQLRFSACPIPGTEKHRLAKDNYNYPSILISTKGTSEFRPAPIKLEHLRVLYDVDCRISQETKLEENRFTVVTCTDNDQQMQEYFLRVASTIVNTIGQNPTHSEVSKILGNLIELFRVMNEIPKKSLQGIWAELFLISISKTPEELLRSWHISPDDKYDFSSGNQRIEVKSSTSKLRSHHFSLEQLKPKIEVEVLVASMFVERIGTGVSLVELADQIRSKLKTDTDLLLYLDQVIGKTLGNTWRSAIDDRFDIQLAKKSLQLYSADSIPCIEPKIPKEVSDIHLKVDLTDVKTMDKKSLSLKNGLFKSLSIK